MRARHVGLEDPILALKTPLAAELSVSTKPLLAAETPLAEEPPLARATIGLRSTISRTHRVGAKCLSALVLDNQDLALSHIYIYLYIYTRVCIYILPPTYIYTHTH